MPAKIDDRLRDVLKAVPSKLIREACGSRQVAHVQRMTERWGVPLSGATVNLYDVLAWVWSFLVKHGPTLKAVLEASDAEADGPLAVQLIKARIAKLSADARMAELRVAQKENVLVELSLIHQPLMRLADRIRISAEAAQRKWGIEGFEHFHELWEGFDSDVKRMFADSPPAQPDGTANVES